MRKMVEDEILSKMQDGITNNSSKTTFGGSKKRSKYPGGSSTPSSPEMERPPANSQRSVHTMWTISLLAVTATLFIFVVSMDDGNLENVYYRLGNNKVAMVLLMSCVFYIPVALVCLASITLCRKREQAEVVDASKKADDGADIIVKSRGERRDDLSKLFSVAEQWALDEGDGVFG
jgi:hypothetical protein